MANFNKSFNFRNGVQVDNDNFIVNANGLVGIGTTIPKDYILNVYGDTRVTGLVTTNNLYTVNSVTAGISTVGFLTASQGISVSGVVTATSFSGSASGLTDIYAIAVDGWYIDGGFISTTSNVGLGTTIPGASLNVVPSSTGIAGLFSGSTSSDMVRITQTGSGNALVVEDYTNQDSTPVVISATGRIGIGTINPTNARYAPSYTQLVVSGDSTSLRNGITIDAYTTPGIAFQGRFIEAESNIKGYLFYYPFNSANTYFLDDLQQINERGFVISPSERNVVAITSSFLATSSNINVGIGTVNPTAKLDVNGSLNVSGVSTISVNSSSDALRITQTGTGNALVVEDSANPDSTPLVINSSGQVGLGTTNPTSDFQLRKASGSLLEVVSDSGEARISVGQSIGVGNSSAVLRFGNSDKTFDIINNDVGDIKNIIHGGTGAGSTGNFKWIYGQTNSETMTLTYDGNLGINDTTPSQKLSVGGGVTITGSVHVNNNLTVDGNITGNINYPSVIDGTNLNNTSGITTLSQLKVSNSVDFDGTTFVGLGTVVGIGTTISEINYGLTVKNNLSANFINVTEGIDTNTGFVTSTTVTATAGFKSNVLSPNSVQIDVYSSPDRIVFTVLGVGSTTLNLF